MKWRDDDNQYAMRTALDALAEGQRTLARLVPLRGRALVDKLAKLEANDLRDLVAALVVAEQLRTRPEPPLVAGDEPSA